LNIDDLEIYTLLYQHLVDVVWLVNGHKTAHWRLIPRALRGRARRYKRDRCGCSTRALSG